MASVIDWSIVGNLSGVAAQLGLLGVTALYLRGKMDGVSQSDVAHTKAADAALLREQSRTEEDLQQVRDSSTSTAAGLRYHLEECGRHYSQMEGALRELRETMDRRFNELQAQINHVASGRAGQFQKVE